MQIELKERSVRDGAAISFHRLCFKHSPNRDSTGNLSKGERDGISSCVPLSESVPAFAIKSGRGTGWRVLKCSLQRVGFCLLRAVSERLLAVRYSRRVRCSSVAVPRRASACVFWNVRWQCQRGDRALYYAELGGKSSRPQRNKIFSDANKVILNKPKHCFN